MGTLVSFHAHPDDENTTTGGSLARASAEGHRVVVVIATNGDYRRGARRIWPKAKRWSIVDASRLPDRPMRSAYIDSCGSGTRTAE